MTLRERALIRLAHVSLTFADVTGPNIDAARAALGDLHDAVVREDAQGDADTRAVRQAVAIVKAVRG